MSLSFIPIPHLCGQNNQPECSRTQNNMKRVIFALSGFSVLAGILVATTPSSGQSGGEAAPIYGIELPQGYRDWHLISVKRLTGAGGKLKQLRAQLGNDIAIKAFREGKVPFPDGAMIAALRQTPTTKS